jgi:hypothetical protein
VLARQPDAAHRVVDRRIRVEHKLLTQCDKVRDGPLLKKNYNFYGTIPPVARYPFALIAAGRALTAVIRREGL